MHIRLANNEEVETRDRLTYEAWGSPLSQDQFLERERRLRQCPWARESMQTWLAIEEAGAVVSSCETFRMASRLRGDSGHSYGIASVYTEERHRGRGYASRLLSQMMAQVEAEDSKVQAFLLYSEVGAAIYERLGFAPRPTSAWIAQADSRQPRADVVVEPVDDITSFLRAYNAIPDTYRILPSVAQLGWFWEREAVYAALLGRQKPKFHALSVGRSFSIWMVDYKRSLFRALLFQASDSAAATAMLDVAVAECRRLQLEAVKVWDTPGANIAAAPHLRKAEPEATLPMIRPATDCRQGWEPSYWRDIPRALWV